MVGAIHELPVLSFELNFSLKTHVGAGESTQYEQKRETISGLSPAPTKTHNFSLPTSPPPYLPTSPPPHLPTSPSPHLLYLTISYLSTGNLRRLVEV